MAKSKPNPSAAPVLATPIADFQKLDATNRAVRFVQIATVAAVSFIELGKLHYLISEEVAAFNATAKGKKKDITNEIRSLAGIKKTDPQARRLDKAISNASYASRMYRELVAPGHISEATFDQLTWSDTQCIVKVMGARSARQLTAEDVATIMDDHPRTYDDELACLFEHGCTVAEKSAADAAEAEKAAATAAAQRQAEIDAAAEKQAAEKAAAAAKKAGSPAAKADPSEETEEGTVEKETTTETETATPQGKAKPSATSTAPAATHTGQETGQVSEDDNADAGLDDILAMIAEIETETEPMTAGAQEQVRVAFAAAAAKIAERLTPAAVAA